MNVLAVNGSPRGEKSHTDYILKPFMQGAADAGASAEILYLKDLKVKPCMGCFSCWFQSPGVCILKDDMSWILNKVLAADVIVLATPLYNCTVTASMKAFMERLLPLVKPYVIINKDGEMAHPLRYPEKSHWKYVLISNAGMPEVKHFEVLEELVRRKMVLSGGGGYATLVASILKGMGGAFSGAPVDPGSLEWFFDACRKAGGEVVKKGRILAETQKILDRPLLKLTPKQYVEALNKFIDFVFEHGRPKE